MKMIQSTEHRAVARIEIMASALLLAGLLAVLLLVARPVHASTTFTVDTTGDGGDANINDNICDASVSFLSSPCTLRAAIQEANDTGGPDTIDFDIPGSGVKTIKPHQTLPTITEQVTIDGYTQNGAVPNSLAAGGTNANLTIELNGEDTVDANEEGLLLQAPNNVVKGLVINSFGECGIALSTATANSKVEGNFIGTDASGIDDLGNGAGGVCIASTAGNNNSIGGTSPAARNLISGNETWGVQVYSNANTVQGNLVGTDKDGTGALGNSYAGARIGSSTNVFGGSDAASANVVAFNGQDGVVLFGNPVTGNRILRNSIFSNGGLGIDLIGEDESLTTDVRTANDNMDPDTGPNTLQNKPVITSAKTSSSATTIQGKLNSTPNETFIIQLFANPSGSDEGKRFIGEKYVTTGSDGKVSFTYSPAQKVHVGRAVTATATRDDTSEFSSPRAAVAQ